MPSNAYTKWRRDRRSQLDEIAASHLAGRGLTRGRPIATLQINQSYAVMVSSQFQGFCRDLHDESISHFISFISPSTLQTTIHELLTQGRKLDRGNPSPDNIGSDFNRFGISFWPAVQRHDTQRVAQFRLSMLTDWRNAIAHQDFDAQRLHGITTLTLKHVGQWRKACERLARIFDSVMHDYLRGISGRSPW